jgi:hypothetical protein
MPWKEAQEQRRQNYKMGRLVSADWTSFVADVESDEEYIVLNAELINQKLCAVLELETCSNPSSNYPTIKIHAESFKFQTGDRELSLESFLEFGAAYWNNFAEESKALSNARELAR